MQKTDAILIIPQPMDFGVIPDNVTMDANAEDIV
jgi:hypothetical protein